MSVVAVFGTKIAAAWYSMAMVLVMMMLVMLVMMVFGGYSFIGLSFSYIIIKVNFCKVYPNYASSSFASLFCPPIKFIFTCQKVTLLISSIGMLTLKVCYAFMHIVAFYTGLCLFICLLKELGSEQAKSHWLHLFDFSPLCVFKCVLKWPA